MLQTPAQRYMRELLAADPSNWPARQPAVIRSKPVVQAQGIRLERGGKALGVPENVRLHAGDIVGLQGGKVALAMCCWGY